MKVDRFMVNAFFEIKRSSPLETQHKFRISDPHVGDTIIALYNSTDDEKIKLLSRAFLIHAGDEWLEKLEPKKWNFLS